MSARPIGRSARLLALVLVVGCTPSVDPSRVPGVTSAAPATAAPAPSNTPGSPTALELEAHVVEQAFTTPLLAAVTDGVEIAFSSGAADGAESEFAPDLYRYLPDGGAPELIWRNPDRERHLLPIEVDHGRYAFVDYPPTEDGAPWNFYLLADAGAEPILLDREVRQAGVRKLVPSFDLDGERIAWTAFDAGPDGAVSELWIAEAPHWTPRRLRGIPLSEGELWMPSLEGDRLAYVETMYNADHSDDVRHVLLTDLREPGAPTRRLDETGLATMPILHGDEVIWKENTEGFNMFNWGRLVRYSLTDGSTTRLRTSPQDHVTYPSVGRRFVAYWGLDSTVLTVHDLERRSSRIVRRLEPTSNETHVRAHVGGDILVWIHGESDANGVQLAPLELMWAWLPAPGGDG